MGTEQRLQPVARGAVEQPRARDLAAAVCDPLSPFAVLCFRLHLLHGTPLRVTGWPDTYGPFLSHTRTVRP